MNAFTRDGFVAWMERLARLPWPMTLDVFTDLAPELGWHFTGYQYSFTADFAAGTRKVVVIDNKAGDVHTISFVLAKPALEGVELLTELNDFFSSYVAAASETWGPPIRTVQGRNPVAAWALPQACITEITRSEEQIHAKFLTPQGARFY